MGKNHKHKKKVKSERAKTQITSKTKFLPKGLNVTNTAFKIKPILIKDQLKEKNYSLLLSKKKQSVTELTAKLRHHNDQMKCEACEELQVLIKQHSIAVLQTHLAVIVQSGSGLIQDRERKVRRASVRLINEIVKNTQVALLRPFFNNISINLRCAMTNIDKNIQEDSLLLLDSLLEYVPALVAENSDKIFPDFLVLISKLRFDSGVERTLSLNLGSKVTSVRWRIKVLSRLHGVLNAMIAAQSRSNKNTISTSGDNVSKRIMVTSNTVFCPIYSDIRPFEGTFSFTAPAGDGSRSLSVHVSALIPLLYETWLEVLPEKSDTRNLKEATVLNEEAATILSCIIHVLQLLYDFGKADFADIFTSHDCEKFLEYLLLNFPYNKAKGRATETLNKDFSKLFVIRDDPMCLEENLMICRMFYEFKLGLNNKNCRKKVGVVTSFLNRHLATGPAGNIKHIIPILKEILLENPNLWRKFGVDVSEFTKHSVDYYRRIPDTDPNKTGILEILTKVSSMSRDEDWLAEMPKMLLESQINDKVVHIILNLCKQGCARVHEGLLQHLEDILGNLPKLKVISTDENMTKLCIAYLFFYVPSLNHSHVKKIENFITNNPDLDFARRFKEILEFRYYNMDNMEF